MIFTQPKQAETKGSGIGDWRPVKRVKRVADIRLGEHLAIYSARFNALNIVRVTQISESDKTFHGVFVDPATGPLDPLKLRLPDDEPMSFWEGDLTTSNFAYTLNRGKLTRSELSRAINRYAKRHCYFPRTVRDVTRLRRLAVQEWKEDNHPWQKLRRVNS